MSKTHIGDANGIAQRVINEYIGDANNKARLIRRAYIGDENNIARKIYEATPNVLYLITGGVNTIGFTVCKAQGYTSECKIEEKTGYLLVQTESSHVSTGLTGLTQMCNPYPINTIKNYSTLKIDFSAGKNAGKVKVEIGTTNQYNYGGSESSLYNSGNVDSLARQTLSFDISNISSNNKYIFVRVQDNSRGSTARSYAWIYDMWLE